MNKRQNPTDRYIIEQYKSGITSVLPQLVKRYHKLFCEKAYWVTKDKDVAKDIAQDSWITIIDKIQSLKNVDSFKSWAFRIVYTKAIDFVKIQNRAKIKLKTIAIDEEDESIVENKELIIKELSKAIQLLPKEKQDIIRLFYVEEYSLQEISTFLKIPLGTVKSRLFKTREKLKSILKDSNYEK